MKVPKICNTMLLLGILSVMVVCAGAAPVQAKSVDVSVQVPTSVTSGAAFDVTVTITNKRNSPINLKRWFITYVVPNLVYKGPYDISGPTVTTETLAEGGSTHRTFSLKISGAKGVAVPVMAFIQGEESWYDWNSETPTLKWKLDAVWGGLGIITVK